MMNMHWDALDFELPAVPGRQWHLAVDTAAPSPGDIAEAGHGAAGDRRHAPRGRPEHRRADFADSRDTGQQYRQKERAGQWTSKNSLSDTTVGTGFAFSDTIAGYVRSVDADRNGFQPDDIGRTGISASASHGGVLRRTRAQPGRVVHRLHRPDARHARSRAGSSTPTASSTPTRRRGSRPQHIIFVGRGPTEFVVREAGLVGAPDPGARQLLLPRAVRRRPGRLPELPHDARPVRPARSKRPGRRPTRSPG